MVVCLGKASGKKPESKELFFEGIVWLRSACYGHRSWEYVWHKLFEMVPNNEELFAILTPVDCDVSFRQITVRLCRRANLLDELRDKAGDP